MVVVAGGVERQVRVQRARQEHLPVRWTRRRDRVVPVPRVYPGERRPCARVRSPAGRRGRRGAALQPPLPVRTARDAGAALHGLRVRRVHRALRRVLLRVREPGCERRRQ